MVTTIVNTKTPHRHPYTKLHSYSPVQNLLLPSCGFSGNNPSCLLFTSFHWSTWFICQFMQRMGKLSKRRPPKHWSRFLVAPVTLYVQLTQDNGAFPAWLKVALRKQMETLFGQSESTNHNE